MNWCAVLCVAAAVLTAGEAQNALPGNSVISECKPGEIYDADGSKCLCPDSGLRNEAECISNPTYSSEEVVERYPGPFCKRGQKIMLDSMICICPASGRTEEAYCPNPIPGRITIFSQPIGRKCQPDIFSDFFRLLFSIPTCLARLGMCFPPIKPYVLPFVRGEYDECIPEEFYISKNGLCKCPKSGIKTDENCMKPHFKRSSKAAPITEMDESRCIPGEMYNKNGYWCVCPPWGDINDLICPRPKPDSRASHNTADC